MESLPLLFLAYYWDPGDIKHTVYHSVGTISNIWQMSSFTVIGAVLGVLSSTYPSDFY